MLIFSHEPQENQSDSRLNGSRPMRETTLYSKALAARSRGAVALLVVSDPSHRVDEANYKMFEIESDAEDHQIPVLRMRRDEVAPLIKAWDLDRTAAVIDRDLIPRSRALPESTVDYTQRLSLNRRTVRNVVGILRGADASRARRGDRPGGALRPRRPRRPLLGHARAHRRDSQRRRRQRLGDRRR